MDEKKEALSLILETTEKLVEKNRILAFKMEKAVKDLEQEQMELKEYVESVAYFNRRGGYTPKGMKVIKNKSVLEHLIGKDAWLKNTIKRSASLKAKIERLVKTRKMERKKRDR